MTRCARLRWWRGGVGNSAVLRALCYMYSFRRRERRTITTRTPVDSFGADKEKLRVQRRVDKKAETIDACNEKRHGAVACFITRLGAWIVRCDDCEESSCESTERQMLLRGRVIVIDVMSIEQDALPDLGGGLL